MSSLKLTVSNRYSRKHTLEIFEKYAIFTTDKNTMYLRTGGAVDFIEFIDPEGGPYIWVGASLNDIHSKAPELYITKIKYLKGKKHYKFYVNKDKPDQRTPAP